MPGAASEIAARAGVYGTGERPVYIFFKNFTVVNGSAAATGVVGKWGVGTHPIDRIISPHL